jgi:medium-chain acyl-[acyl-carrier-protein] hydrolase
MNMLVPPAGTWFQHQHVNPEAKVRLFCFPYAGGNPSIFREWGPMVGSHAELFAMQLPGRGARLAEPPMRSLNLIVHCLANAITPLLDRPCVFFGYSNGALICFELARELARRGEPGLHHVIISAKRAPHLPRLGPVTFNLPDAQFVEVLREYDGTPEEILADASLLNYLLPSIRADFGLSDLYQHRPGSPLECAMTLFGSMTDRYVPFDDLLAWQEHTKLPDAVKVFDGGHFFLHQQASQVIAEVTLVLSAVAIAALATG